MNKKWKSIRIEPETYSRLIKFREDSTYWIRSMSQTVDILISVVAKLKKEKKLDKYVGRY